MILSQLWDKVNREFQYLYVSYLMRIPWNLHDTTKMTLMVEDAGGKFASFELWVKIQP